MKLNFLITAGPTREYLDPVRYISNASSGKMGYAVASAARSAGHNVMLVTGPVEIPKPKGVKLVHVVTAAQMSAETKKLYSWADVVIATAAVADYGPALRSRSKIKKSGKSMTLKLEPTEDILSYLGKHKKAQVLIGFALESVNLIKSARAKLLAKNLDAIVANYPDSIGADRGSVWIINSEENIEAVKNATKVQIAKRILDEAYRARLSRSRRTR
jgi:phosphopantothenoylcysteine synthetase/decarboxylase